MFSFLSSLFNAVFSSRICLIIFVFGFALFFVLFIRRILSTYVDDEQTHLSPVKFVMKYRYGFPLRRSKE